MNSNTLSRSGEASNDENVQTIDHKRSELLIFLSDDFEDFLSRLSFDKAATESGVLEQSRDSRQGLQMIGGSILRGNQDKKQVRRSAIQRSEINSLQTTSENADDAFDPAMLSMRDRHTFTNGSCADALPFQQNLKNLFLIKPWMISNQPGGHFF